MSLSEEEHMVSFLLFVREKKNPATLTDKNKPQSDFHHIGMMKCADPVNVSTCKCISVSVGLSNRYIVASIRTETLMQGYNIAKYLLTIDLKANILLEIEKKNIFNKNLKLKCTSNF